MFSRTPVFSFKFLAVLTFAVATALAVSGDHSSAAGATQEPKTMRAAAVVNDIIISTFDLEQRIKLVMVTSGAQGADAAKRLRPQVLRQLVDELLQLQEAQKLKVTITQEELDKNFKRIADQNKTTTDQINKMLDENGIARSSLANQLKADLAWQKLIQGRLAPRVTVTEEEIDAAYQQMLTASNQTQYGVSEIFVAVDVPEAEDQAKQNIQQILGHLRAGATFSAIARQFSQSASRTNGGDIGWVSEGDLPASVAAVVKTMSPGAVSEPIRAPGGYYVIGLRERRLPQGSKVSAAAPPPKPQAAQKMRAVISIGRVSIALAGGASKAKQEQTKNLAIELYRSINGCGTASSVARSRGAKFEMIGEMSVKDMAPEFVKILSQTPNGRSTPPLRGQSGVEMFVVCAGGMIPAPGTQTAAGPTETVAPEVTRDAVENRLFNQELSMHARRYLRDLRRDATIEMRDN
jgi:peptidyl-prolyl cis-trans isomerase SurA